MANRKARLDPKVLTISDLKDEAAKRLPSTLTQYLNEGAGDMITYADLIALIHALQHLNINTPQNFTTEATYSLHDNEAAFNRYRLRPRILRNVDGPDLSSSLFGIPTAGPIGFAPTAAHAIAHAGAETTTAHAAASNNIPLCLSSWSTTSLEDVIGAANERREVNAFAMQVTFLRDRSATEAVIRRAEKAGYRAIFVSVDLPVLGNRLNESRNAFSFPSHIGFPNLPSTSTSHTFHGPAVESSGLITTNSLDYDPTPNWDEAIPWLRSVTKMEIWLKGVYTPEDVRLAVEHGVEGVVISNHGGRQLDGVPATLDALRDCAGVFDGVPSDGGKRLQIAMDGGVRKGSDVFKALALGADFVFVGRPVLWGLAYNGKKGVDLAVKILLDELRQTMMLCGCRTIAEISRSHLSVLRCDGVLAKL